MGSGDGGKSTEPGIGQSPPRAEVIQERVADAALGDLSEVVPGETGDEPGLPEAHVVAVAAEPEAVAEAIPLFTEYDRSTKLRCARKLCVTRRPRDAVDARETSR